MIQGITLTSKIYQQYIVDKYRFEFKKFYVQRYVQEGDRCTIWPMHAYNGEVKGAIVKPFSGQYKSLTYKYDTEYNGLSWYRDARGISNPQVFVVEDPVSALALFQMKGCAVSLNGTNLNQDRMDDMLSRKWQIVLMLDADATHKAIKYCTQYGPDVLRVVRLTRDVKNMSADEVQELLYRERL
jgi:hypothetical protein